MTLFALFSRCRYNTSATILRAPNGASGSNSILDNSTGVAKRESVGDMQVYSTDHVVYQTSNGVSDNNLDMGSTTNKLPKHKSEATSATNVVHPSAFRPIKKDLRYYGKQQDSLLPSEIPTESQMNHIYHHHHHHNHFHIENQLSSNHDESSLKKLATEAPHCGSTNVFGERMDSNPGNCDLNRSGSGSNHGSNGQNGSSTPLNALGNNAESDVGQAGKSGSGDASGSGSGSGNKVDEDKFAQRAAALIKFRQKRKERCFQKKVVVLIIIYHYCFNCMIW